jgi:hypothetical protein
MEMVMGLCRSDLLLIFECGITLKLLSEARHTN